MWAQKFLLKQIRSYEGKLWRDMGVDELCSPAASKASSSIAQHAALKKSQPFLHPPVPAGSKSLEGAPSNHGVYTTLKHSLPSKFKVHFSQKEGRGGSRSTGAKSKGDGAGTRPPCETCLRTSHAGSTETPGTQGSAAGHGPEATLLV